MIFFYNKFPIHNGPLTLDTPPPYLRFEVIKNLKDLREAEPTVGEGSGMFVTYVPTIWPPEFTIAVSTAVVCRVKGFLMSMEREKHAPWHLTPLHLVQVFFTI